MKRTAILAAVLVTVGLFAACGGTAQGAGSAATAGAAVAQSVENGGEQAAEKAQAGEQAVFDGVTSGDTAGASAETQADEEAYDYRGKTVSFSGDSITTFSGYIPDGYVPTYPEDDLQEVAQAWWMQVIDRMGMEYLANASFSGGTVSGKSLDSTGRYGSSFRRADDLAGPEGEAPDVIFILNGTNDFIQSKPLGTYEAGKTIAEGEVGNFADAYALMVTKLRAQYPQARIICMTCIPVTRWSDENRQDYSEGVNELGLTIRDYNEVIRQVAEGFGCLVVDTYESFTDAEANRYTYDGVHPNAAGAEKMAAYIVRHLQ